MFRNIHERLNEHRKDIRVGNLNYELLQHIPESDDNFDFNATTMLVYIYNRRLRRIFEAGVSSIYYSIKKRSDFYNIFPYLAKHILNIYNIFRL